MDPLVRLRRLHRPLSLLQQRRQKKHFQVRDDQGLRGGLQGVPHPLQHAQAIFHSQLLSVQRVSALGKAAKPDLRMRSRIYGSEAGFMDAKPDLWMRSRIYGARRMALSRSAFSYREERGPRRQVL
eukprot:scaffold193_cov255-Pinguiococcus_pyrenoidosus.AAC.19